MAIALQPKFPIPDRASQPVRSMKDEDGVIDIGWCEGILSDGRAFRAEMWAQDQISSLTFFFSTIGLETLEQDEMKHFVEKEGLVTFKKSGPTYCQALPFRDDGGNQVWCGQYRRGGRRRDLQSTTLFRSFPIQRSASQTRFSIQFRSRLRIKSRHTAGRTSKFKPGFGGQASPEA